MKPGRKKSRGFGRPLIEICGECKTVFWMPTPICAHCGADIEEQKRLAAEEHRQRWIERWDVEDINGQRGVFVAHCRPGFARGCHWFSQARNLEVRSRRRVIELHEKRDARIVFNTPGIAEIPCNEPSGLQVPHYECDRETWEQREAFEEYVAGLRRSARWG